MLSCFLLLDISKGRVRKDAVTHTFRFHAKASLGAHGNSKSVCNVPLVLAWQWRWHISTAPAPHPVHFFCCGGSTRKTTGISDEFGPLTPGLRKTRIMFGPFIYKVVRILSIFGSRCPKQDQNFDNFPYRVGLLKDTMCAVPHLEVASPFQPANLFLTLNPILT